MTSHRWRLTIAYLILAAALGFVAHQSAENQDRIERESIANQDRIERQAEVSAALNCKAINEAKVALDNVLLALAAPREDDEPGDAEERQRLYELVEPLVQPGECPPDPTETP